MRLAGVGLNSSAFLFFTDLRAKKTCDDCADSKCSPNAKTHHCDGE
jgi:hypothetical protein